MNTTTQPAAVPSSAALWPEVEAHAVTIADDVCRRINRDAPNVQTANVMRYKAQGMLEAVIAILQSRV